MGKPTIAIDARPLCGPWNGTTMYIQSVVETLLNAGFKVTLLSDERIKISNKEPFLNCEDLVIGSHHGGLWEQIDLLRHLKRSDYDIYFVGSNKGLPLLYFGKTKLVLGLLDIIPMLLPRTYLLRPPFKSILTYFFPQLASILKAQQIITISETSARDIKRLFPYKKVDAILLRLPDTIMRTSSKVRKDQFVYVGGVDPRKPLNSLFLAFKEFLKRHPDYKLILIGKDYNAIQSRIGELGLNEALVLTGYVSDKEKMKIISESRAMVYPSLYEGYGLAIAEAMLATTPVIAGRGGSQVEVGGNAVLYINPLDHCDILEKMEMVIQPSVAKELLSRAPDRIKVLADDSLDTDLANYFKNV